MKLTLATEKRRFEEPCSKLRGMRSLLRYNPDDVAK